MKKLIFTSLLLVFTFSAFAQKKKIKVKNKIKTIYVDDKVFMTYESFAKRIYKLYLPNKKHVITIRYFSYKDSLEIKPSNPTGTVTYSELQLVGFDERLEFGGYSFKYFTSLFLKHNLIVDGKLDLKSAKEFIDLYAD